MLKQLTQWQKTLGRGELREVRGLIKGSSIRATGIFSIEASKSSQISLY
jgi:hypothetical protein